jgi:hypothetical protein
MKPSTLALLVLSHGALVLLGGWLAGGLKKQPESAAPAPAPAAVVEKPVSSGSEATSPNPIFRATGADFSAAWNEVLLLPRSSNGEPGSNSINMFVDWCAVDPEGAIQGLGRLYAPQFAHNYLGNAINYHGAELAPALAKHWRSLERMPDNKVRYPLGRAMNALAKKDPEAAAALTGDLPPGPRADVYSSLFEKQDIPSIKRLLKGLPSLASASPEEKKKVWTEVAEAVDVADSQRGLWDWMADADETIARRAIATEGMTKAYKAEDWSGFFDAVERMDASAQTEVRDLVREATRSSSYRPEARAAISAECQRHGLENWIEEPAAK